jgi:hypothetical protein
VPGAPLYEQGGDLKQTLIDDEAGLFDWGRKGKTVALDIARGLHFLHSCDVIHRCCSQPQLFATKAGPMSPLRCGVWPPMAVPSSQVTPTLLLQCKTD